MKMLLKEGILIAVLLTLTFGALFYANHSGAKDRTFYVWDAQTKKHVSVTDSTIRSKFAIAPNDSNCDLMGICHINGKTMLDPKKFN